MTLTTEVTVPRRVLLLIVALSCWLWYLVFVKGWPLLAHWLIHRRGWRYGPMVLWRRKSDGVQMSGHVCPICHQLHHIEPVRISYKRMMRGERFY
jgi:hypothetical protein